jgi:hypothetical protein
MRSIFATLSLLFAICSQAEAATYLVTPGEVDFVVGPFIDNPIPVSISFGFTGGDYIGSIPPNGLVGPYYGYFIDDEQNLSMPGLLVLTLAMRGQQAAARRRVAGIA